MPVTITGANFDQFIEGVDAQITSPELMNELGQSLANQLVSGFHSSGLQSRSGASIAALGYVGDPQRTGTGMSIGVADADALGNPDESAPSGTLRSFFEDNPDIHPSKWRNIPPSYKDKLEQMRRSGMYGGRGVNYANYLWIQERGNSTAEISPHPFLDSALEQWQSNALQIIEEHLAQASRH